MRSAGLDLVKWTAMLTMVADHLRFLWPAADGLFIVGRLAFPLFCLAIAVNVAREQRIPSRYLGWMIAFAVLSEGPYRWLDADTQTFSVIPTLALGLLVAWGVQHALVWARLAGLVAMLAGALFGRHLMYGLPGVLLPAAWLMARRFGGLSWLLPCLLAVAGNLTNSWLRGHLSAPITLLTMAAALLAIPFGCLMLRIEHWRVPAVRRWGYLFYPVHLLVIKVLM
ncbi:TraX family protein [Pseudomonas sp. KU43P]|uniref:TraX family protein n=1 Tax=Pseudomonas sp. KU43P TaxID=2487887 RepID=UPI0012A8BA8D|nr:TraX family protein [Pseudomonas sp. KU43P]BBH46183.1 membrane protein [Pseudomonas sp. KU43P]